MLSGSVSNDTRDTTIVIIKKKGFLYGALILIMALSIVLPYCSYASGLIYTIQTATYNDMDYADKHFDNIVSTLQGSETPLLRIEKTGKHFSVRIGKFESYSDAVKLLKRVQPHFQDAIIMALRINDERIMRFLSDSLSSPENDIETKEPSQSVAGQYQLNDLEHIDAGSRPDPVIQEGDAQDVGDRLSLSMHDADIRSVLRAVAIKNKLNIVAGQDVTGTVSLNIHNLPLKQVLDAIITLNGFSYVQRGDIIFVTKSDKSKGGDLPGAEVMIFQLKYVDITEVEKVIGELVSESGMITVYKPDKTLIVKDVPRKLAQIKKVLETLDRPPRQVLIEARIMEVRLNDDTSLGIDWNDAFRGFLNSSGNISTAGFTGMSQGFFFDIVNGDFNLFLDALQTKTEVKTLSSPKLLALDNKEAKIIVGEKLGYNVTTTNDGVSLETVEFLEVGTQLILTPRIVDDENVIMDIHPEISDGIITGGLPTETTTEVTTSLMAPNGGTIFIGGLIRDRKEDVTNRVPVLGAIPVFGALFSKTTNTTVRTEIIVLITPHIITAANHEILEVHTRKVEEVGAHLQKERSLKELFPGTN